MNPSSLVVTTVSGVTGSAQDIQSGETFRPVMKLQRFENIALKTPTGFADMAPSASDLNSAGVNISFESGSSGSGGGTFDRVIQFGPQGGARIDPASIPRWLQLGLVPTHGNPDNDAAIQVAGLTGQVRTFRR